MADRCMRCNALFDEGARQNNSPSNLCDECKGKCDHCGAALEANLRDDGDCDFEAGNGSGLKCSAGCPDWIKYKR